MGVKKFIKKSVAFVAAAAMALTMVVAPVGAGATYAEGTTSDSGLNLDKSVELQSDGTYKITLKSYGTGQYVPVQEKIGTPLDIVLVLDQSGSMDDSVNGVKKIDSLKTAVTNFVTSISNNEKEFKKAEHRIAIVGYASRYDSNSKWANTGLFINGSLYNYQRPGSSEKTSRLTDKNYQDALVNVNNSDGSINNSITTAIKNIGANGATYTNYGLEMANKVFSNNPIESGSNRKRIVVVFTDGQPGQSSYEKDVAGSAVNEAYKTKNTYGATVYSVGFYDSANSNVTNFMNYISSNYPGAEYKDVEKQYWWGGTYIDKDFVPGTKAPNAKYYMQASNQEELSKIFNNIYTDIEKPTTSVKLDANAVTRDIITDKLNISDNTAVTAYTEDYKGSDSWQRSANQVDLTSTINKDTKTVDVTGFDYAANFVDKTKAKGQRLVIEITGLTANQAGEGMITNVTDKSGVYANAQTENPSEIFNECSISIPSKSYVLDYGKTVTTAASDYGVSAVTIANTGKPSPYGVNLKGTYGTFAINGDDLDYTPGKINWDGIDTGYVFGQKSDSKYKWEEVNFMPANSVYYEDDFASTATVEEGDTGTKIIYNEGKWTVDGKAQNSEKQSSNNEVQHGWDDSYKDDRNYSNGTAHKGTTGATATFKFTGTGVGIYSRTDLTTGKVIATLTKDGEVEASKFMIVDNKSASGTYYQVPTLFFEDLDYGTYEVKIQVLNPIKEGETTRGTYYLDGIRVYNPLGVTTSEKVTNAYNVAGESNAIFTSVRKMLLDAKTFDGDTATKGAVFIDQLDASNNNSSGEAKTATIGTYEKLGPKNEVYLDAGQAIAFKINTPYTGKVFIGAKSLNGQQVSMKVTDITTTEKTKTVTLSHTSDMYYQINPTTEKYVVIQNTNNTKGAILAITKLRLTGVPNATTQSSIDFESSPAVMSYVNEFAKLDSAKTDDRGMVIEKDKSDVDIDNPDNSKDDNNQETKPDQSHSNSIWNSIMNNLRKWFK